MSSVIREVIIKIAIQQADVRLKAPDLGPIFKPFEKFEVKLKGGFDEIGSKVEMLGTDIVDLKPKLEEVSRASEDITRQLTDDSLKAGEGFRTAGEGAFTLARGIACVGASGDEEFQKMLKTLAQFQGAFDIFKGGLDLIKGFTEGTRALRVVTASTVVAETSLAAAKTAVGTTGGATAGGMGALTASMGPIAIVAAAVGAAFLFFKSAPGDIDETSEALGALQANLEGLGSIKLDTFQAIFDFGKLDPKQQVALIKKRLKEDFAVIEREGLKRQEELNKIFAKIRELNPDVTVEIPGAHDALCAFARMW